MTQTLTPLSEPIGHVPPEEFLATRIAEILGYHPVDPRDNIFDLGMDSLSLVDLRDTIKDVFGVSVSFTDFFSHYTVAALAELIDSMTQGVAR